MVHSMQPSTFLEAAVSLYIWNIYPCLMKKREKREKERRWVLTIKTGGFLAHYIYYDVASGRSPQVMQI